MATVLFEEGVDPLIVSQHLGHASTWFTQDTYTHLRESMAGKAAEAMERALGGGS